MGAERPAVHSHPPLSLIKYIKHFQFWCENSEVVILVAAVVSEITLIPRIKVAAEPLHEYKCI